MTDIINSVEGMNTAQPTAEIIVSVNETRQLTHREVLDNLLSQVEPVNFFKEVFQRSQSNEETTTLKIDPKSKLDERHYLVISIEKLIALAEDNLWGLCMHQGQVYVYNGAYWSPISEAELRNFLGNVALRMGVDEYVAKSHNFRDQLVKQFFSAAYINPPTFYEDRVKINMRSGTFEITADRQELKLFDPQDFMTYQLPFDYNPAAEAPLFHAYMNEVLPDEDCRKVLAEYIGYLFLRSNKLKLEKALLLYGSGANGKSVFFEIITALLGSDNVSNYTLYELTSRADYRAELVNVLVNYASEIGCKLDNVFFKAMVSGEPVGARMLYGRPFKAKNYGKLIFNCNELPRDVEHSNAYFRRFLIIPFDVTIPPERQIKDLHTRIIASELSGVFNWVLDGLRRLVAQGEFSPCDAVEKAVEQYKFESDSVAQFFDEYGYEKSTDSSMDFSSVYSLYDIYCENSGVRPMGKPSFGRRLRGSGIEIVKASKGMVVYMKKRTDK